MKYNTCYRSIFSFFIASISTKASKADLSKPVYSSLSSSSSLSLIGGEYPICRSSRVNPHIACSCSCSFDAFFSSNGSMS